MAPNRNTNWIHEMCWRLIEHDSLKKPINFRITLLDVCMTYIVSDLNRPWKFIFCNRDKLTLENYTIFSFCHRKIRYHDKACVYKTCDKWVFLHFELVYEDNFTSLVKKYHIPVIYLLVFIISAYFMEFIKKRFNVL